MNRLDKKITILEEKKTKDYAFVVPKASETKNEAIKRHMTENPQDLRAKIIIVDNSIEAFGLNDN